MAEKKIVAGVVSHPTLKQTAEVLLWGTGFRCTFKGQIVDGATYADVERQVLARMEATAGLEWVPIIELRLAREHVRDFSDNLPTAAGASLSFRRYWFAVAKKLNDGVKDDHRGSWSGKMEAPWECTTDAQRQKKAKPVYIYFAGARSYESEKMGFPRNADGTLRFPAQVWESNGNGAHLLLYTEPLWQTLLVIVQRLHDTRAQLATMVSSAENVALLESLGQRLMAAGSMLALQPGEGETVEVRKVRKHRI